MKHNYTAVVRDAVKDYFLENLNQVITDYDVNEMDNDEVLHYYLEWEGIFGYTNIILMIMEA